MNPRGLEKQFVLVLLLHCSRCKKTLLIQLFGSSSCVTFVTVIQNTGGNYFDVDLLKYDKKSSAVTHTPTFTTGLNFPSKIVCEDPKHTEGFSLVKYKKI